MDRSVVIEKVSNSVPCQELGLVVQSESWSICFHLVLKVGGLLEKHGDVEQLDMCWCFESDSLNVPAGSKG